MIKIENENAELTGRLKDVLYELAVAVEHCSEFVSKETGLNIKKTHGIVIEQIEEISSLLCEENKDKNHP